MAWMAPETVAGAPSRSIGNAAATSKPLAHAHRNARPTRDRADRIKCRWSPTTRAHVAALKTTKANVMTYPNGPVAYSLVGLCTGLMSGLMK